MAGMVSSSVLKALASQCRLAVALRESPLGVEALRCLSVSSCSCDWRASRPNIATSTASASTCSPTNEALTCTTHSVAAAPASAHSLKHGVYSTRGYVHRTQFPRASVQLPRTFSTSASSSSPGEKKAEESSSTGPTTEDAGSSSSAGGDSSSAGSDGSTSSGPEAAAGSAAGSTAAKAKHVLSDLARDVAATLLPRQDVRSATRMYTGPLFDEPAAGEGPSELVYVKPKPAMWQSAWGTVVSKLPFLSRLGSIKVSDSAAYKKGAEVAENLRERWETSDHPAVHKVEDYKERFFSGSESSRAMLEVRSRDPAFDLNTFVQSVKKDGPPVVKAFLRHDLDTLRLHCGPELIERFTGIFKHFSDQGLQEDPTILFTGDVEIVEVRMVGEDPWIIAQFHCQQLKCTRDKFGNVVEGSPDSIQRVYYFWGLQQERFGVITAEGERLPPRWVIKDMMWQSMLALV